nr:integrase core domain-containing protein [Haliangium ochraceum]
MPPRSPNLNAYAERFVRSVKSECLDELVLLGERHLRSTVSEYATHYHTERTHQGIGSQNIQSIHLSEQTGAIVAASASAVCSITITVFLPDNPRSFFRTLRAQRSGDAGATRVALSALAGIRDFGRRVRRRRRRRGFAGSARNAPGRAQAGRARGRWRRRSRQAAAREIRPPVRQYAHAAARSPRARVLAAPTRRSRRPG